MKYEEAIRVLENAHRDIENLISRTHKKEQEMQKKRLAWQERSKIFLEAIVKLRRAKT